MIWGKRAPGIDAEAARWVARLDRGQLDDGERAAFDRWIAADARHLGAYARAEAVFSTFDRARALKAPGGLPAPANNNRRVFLGWATAAAAAAVAGVGLMPRQDPPRGDHYVNNVGEMRVIALADGSRMTLGTAADVVVRFDDRIRRIELTRGLALFDVASDAARPFTVMAGQMTVTAVGTSFSVDHPGAGDGSLLVRHGVVAISAGTGAEPHLVRAGTRAAWSSAAPRQLQLTRLNGQELRRQLAWTEGMLAFDGSTMADASAEFARFSDFRIVIADPGLANRRVTGWFSTTDPRGFAHAAAASLGAVAEDRENAVIIRPAP